MTRQGKSNTHRYARGLVPNPFERSCCRLQSTFRMTSNWGLGLLVALTMAVFSACSHSAGNGPEASAPGTEARYKVDVRQAWQGDYPVDLLEVLPEEQGQPGAGYIGDMETFSAVWASFKPGEPEPGIDFDENLVIFTRNVVYYNRISIGTVWLNQGVAEMVAAATLSARPVEDKVSIAMAVISRAGVQGVQGRNGVIRVAD